MSGRKFRCSGPTARILARMCGVEPTICISTSTQVTATMMPVRDRSLRGTALMQAGPTHQRWHRGALDIKWELDPATFQTNSGGQASKDSKWILGIPDGTGAQPEIRQKLEDPRSPAGHALVSSPQANQCLAVELFIQVEGNVIR